MTKEFVYNEMTVHVPICSHKNPRNILLIGDNIEGIKDELNRHNNLEVTTGGLDSIATSQESSYDIVIIDSTATISDATYAHLNRIVKEDGLVAALNASLENERQTKEQLKALGAYFKIIMPYFAENKTIILASKEYHPTADIILQRADLIDGLSYYNCDIHIASFAMPNYIRSRYLGIIKN